MAEGYYPPPGGYPPGSYHPYGAYQPVGYPPGAYPPGAVPPGVYPPPGMPPGMQVCPPGYPPQGYPPQAFPQGPAPGMYGGYPGGPIPGQVPMAGYQHMMPEIYAPTVHPSPTFNVEQDCEALRKAMKGLGTDEDTLIAILTHRSWQQRAEIEKAYKQKFAKVGLFTFTCLFRHGVASSL